MNSANKSLLLKIKSLEKDLKQKEKGLKKYAMALKDSNQRVEQILKDLQESKALIRNIHKSLLPSHLPKIPQFKFSYKLAATKTGVSGDFFDVIQLNDPLQFGVLLSSCSSYTLTSLFLSLFLKSVPALKEHSTAAGYLQEIFKNFPVSQKNSIHLFYGIVNGRDFTLDYCLMGDVFAGIRCSTPQGKSNSLPVKFQILKSTKQICESTPKTPPFSRRRESPQSELKSSNRITKKQKNHSLTGSLIELKPRDCLILCSPGILHRKNAGGGDFGAKNIIKAALSQKGALAIRQNILFQANQFAGKAPKRDQTLLIMEVKDRVLKLTKTK